MRFIAHLALSASMVATAGAAVVVGTVSAADCWRCWGNGVHPVSSVAFGLPRALFEEAKAIAVGWERSSTPITRRGTQWAGPTGGVG